MQTVRHDLKQAWRSLTQRPAFAFIVVLTFSVGIAACTAIYSAVHAVLLQSLPYKQPDKLVTVCERNLMLGSDPVLASPANYFDWNDRAESFAGMAAVSFQNFNLSGSGQPERLQAGMVTANFFEVAGVQPLLGRTFRREETISGQHFVTVISHRLWSHKFASDPAIIGKTITLNGGPHTVVGVLPPGFRFYHPTRVTGWANGLKDADVWRPLPFGPEDRTVRDSHWLLVIGRLKNHVTLPQAEEELKVLSERIEKENPSYKGWGIAVTPWHQHVVQKMQKPLYLLLGGAGLVLAITCANVANLLLIRVQERRNEFAVRLSLGANRWQVVRQLMTESLVLAGIGSVLGLLFAKWLLQLLVAFNPEQFPRMEEVSVNWSTMGFSAALCLICAAIFGLVPARDVFRTDLNDILKRAGRSWSGVSKVNSLRGALVVSQIALSAILLTSAGLLTRSLWKLMAVDPGFKPERVLAMDISLVDRKYRDDRERVKFAQELVRRAQELPGAESAATVYGLPFSSMIKDNYAVRPEGEPVPSPENRKVTAYRQVSPNYFSTMQVPFLQGRDFSDRDNTNSVQVGIVNHTFAKQFFPGENPIGKRVVLEIGISNVCEIIGIVGDIKPASLDETTPPELYRPQFQVCDWYLSLVVRTAMAPSQMTALLRDAVRSIDPDRPIYNVRSMNHEIEASVLSRRLAMILVGCFAGVALFLAAIGTYGVITFSVSQRTRELGIRMALGAQRHHVMSLILRHGMTIAFLGALIGILGSLAVSKVVASQLFGVLPTDLATFCVVTTAILGVSTLACLLPARKATQVDPVIALKSE